MPHAALGVAVHLDGILHQSAAEVYAGHRPHVDDHRAFIEGHPQTLETVLSKSFARIAGCQQSTGHQPLEGITVITDGSTAIG